jgi:hypothetical protein
MIMQLSLMSARAVVLLAILSGHVAVDSAFAQTRPRARDLRRP